MSEQTVQVLSFSEEKLKKELEFAKHLMGHELMDLYESYERFVQIHRFCFGKDPDVSEIAPLPCMHLHKEEGEYQDVD